MADPYHRYTTPTDRASIPRTRFADCLPSEAPSLASPHLLRSTDLQGVGSDYLQKDINLPRSGAYDDDILGIRVHSDPYINTVTTGANKKDYPSFEDPDIMSQMRVVPPGNNPEASDINNDRPIFKSNHDGIPVSAEESNILFVGGLPNDCTRREVGHLFRPFVGYKDIRVVHKEPRHSGGKAIVLCFVEFIDSKCALTAMEALQGYKLDDKKRESPNLKIHFAHFPFRPPTDHGDQLLSKPR